MEERQLREDVEAKIAELEAQLAARTAPMVDLGEENSSPVREVDMPHTIENPSDSDSEVGEDLTAAELPAGDQLAPPRHAPQPRITPKGYGCPYCPHVELYRPGEDREDRLFRLTDHINVHHEVFVARPARVAEAARVAAQALATQEDKTLTSVATTNALPKKVFDEGWDACRGRREAYDKGAGKREAARASEAAGERKKRRSEHEA